MTQVYHVRDAAAEFPRDFHYPTPNGSITTHPQRGQVNHNVVAPGVFLFNHHKHRVFRVAEQSVRVHERVSVRRQRARRGSADLEHPTATSAVPESVPTASFRPFPRLPVHVIQPVRRIAFHNPHGFRPVTEARAFHVIHGWPATEVGFVHLVRALRPGGFPGTLAAPLHRTHAARVEPVRAFPEVDASSGIFVLRSRAFLPREHHQSASGVKHARAGTNPQSAKQNRG